MLDKRLLKYPGARQTMGLLAVIAVLQGLSIVGQGYFLSLVITRLWQHHAFANVLGALGWFALAYALRQLLNVVKQYVLAPFADRTVAGIQTQLLAKYVELGPSLIARQGTGKSVTLAIDGLNKVHDYLSLVLVKMIDMLTIPLIILIYLAIVRWEQALFLLCIYPVIVMFMIILGLTAQAKADRQYKTFNMLSNHFIDSLRGLTTLKQLGLAKRYADNIYAVSEEHRLAVMSTLKIAILSTFALDFFTTLSIAVVAVFLGLDLLNGAVTLLPALTLLVLAPEYFLPIRNFANDYHATLNGKNALSDIYVLLEQPTTPAQDVYQDTTRGWQADSNLTVKHLQFAYPDNDQNTLVDLNFQMHGFQRIALVGASGSGKSTLLNVLAGMLIGEGDLKINQQQVPHLRQRQWQDDIQVLPQRPYVFHASLRDNLRFYAKDADDVAILTAVENVGLDAWFAELPAGLDTLIGEGALQVSGGQAQRIGLARILLNADRRILMLDEPTAHLDIETEAMLKAQMLPLFNQRLVIFATHRLHWLQQMDWILVMKDGQIVEQGTLAALVANNGYFMDLQAAMRGTHDAKN
ncbi:MAG: thiol reductant ABC exporter subunit CydD [Lactobacillaceae bacterium]|nr:thiol reductant ABC exporter subunit CydD [Lactobacillaceae bacterium]